MRPVRFGAQTEGGAKTMRKAIPTSTQRDAEEIEILRERIVMLKHTIDAAGRELDAARDRQCEATERAYDLAHGAAERAANETRDSDKETAALSLKPSITITLFLAQTAGADDNVINDLLRAKDDIFRADRRGGPEGPAAA